eukprot:gene5373-549_t
MLPRKHKNISRHREARENDQLRKENAMNYANKRRNTKECDIKVGDLVICMQKKTNKFSSRFNVQPYKVVRVYGSKVVARHGDHFISRNSSFFKKVQQRLDDLGSRIMSLSVISFVVMYSSTQDEEDHGDVLKIKPPYWRPKLCIISLV